MLGNVLLDDAHVLDLGVVLRGDHNRGDLDGPAVLVAYGHLSLAVRAQVRQLAALANVGELLGQALREIDGHRHEHVSLVRRIAKHHALVASADEVKRVGGATGLGIERLVHALRDVGALLVNHVDDAAGIAVKAVLGAVIADAAQRVASDALHVHVGLGSNLAGDDHRTRGDERLAGAPHVVDLRGLPVGRHVAISLEARLLLENRVEYRIGDLVADLVRMPLGHRFGREVVAALARNVARRGHVLLVVAHMKSLPDGPAAARPPHPAAKIFSGGA